MDVLPFAFSLKLSSTLLPMPHPYDNSMMLTRFLRALFRERTCTGCHQGEATRGDLCVYCCLQHGLPATDQPDVLTNFLPFTQSHAR
jgi:hypothetical protein